MIAFDYPARQGHCWCGWCTSPTMVCTREVAGVLYARAATRALDRMVEAMREAAAKLHAFAAQLLLQPEPRRCAWRSPRCLCPSSPAFAQHAPFWRAGAGVSPGQRRAIKRRRFIQELRA